MAVFPVDLKTPRGGKLEASMFPDEDLAALEDRLSDYIAEGKTRAELTLTVSAEIDVATKAWAYHRAFEAVFIRLSSTPSSVTLNDQGGASFLVTQIQNFKDLADAALEQFTELVAIEVEGVDTTGWNLVSSLRHA